MKKKKKIKKNKKKYKKRVKIKKPNKKKIFRKKSIKRKQRVKNRAKKPKKPKKLKLEIPESFKVIKKFTLKNLFSYISAPVFEAYYNFQRDRKRKLLKAQEAKDREIERRKRERLELVKKMKEEQVKEELYYSKELKKDMQIFLNEQAREAVPKLTLISFYHF